MGKACTRVLGLLGLAAGIALGEEKGAPAGPTVSRAPSAPVAPSAPASDDPQSLRQQGLAWAGRGEPERAIPFFRRALARGEAQTPRDDAAIATTLGQLARALDETGEFREARAVAERAVALAEKVHGKSSVLVALPLQRLAAALGRLGEDDAARADLERAYTLIKGEFGPNAPELADVLVELARLRLHRHDYQRALAAFEQALPLRERDRGAADLGVADLLGEMALTRSHLRDFDGALEDVDRARQIITEHAGAVSLGAARFRLLRGSILRAKGELAEAALEDLQAAEITEKAASPDHPEVALALNNLGFVRIAQHDIAAARVAFDRAAAILQRSGDKSSAHLAEVLSGLGECALAEKNTLLAKDLYTRALRRREAAPVPDPLATAQIQLGLGRVALSAGDPQAARALFEKAMTLREREVGPDDPLVAEALGALSGALDALGARAAARTATSRALDIWDRQLFPEPAKRAAFYNRVGFDQLAAGQLQLARPMLERALEIGRTALAGDDAAQAGILSNLGALKLAEHSLPAALDFLERALALREKARGPEHFETARSLSNLAVATEQSGDLSRARGLFERAVRIWTKTPEAPAQDVVSGLSDFGLLLAVQGDTAPARSILEKAVSIAGERLDPSDRTLATALLNLATVLQMEGRPDEARGLLLRALKAQAPLESSPLAAALCHSLGVLAFSQGDFKAARARYQTALDLTEKQLGSAHPLNAPLLANLAMTMQRLGDAAAAKTFAQSALRIVENSGGAELPDLTRALNTLAVMEAGAGDMAACRAHLLRASAAMDRFVDGVLPTLSFAEQRVFLESRLPEQTALLATYCMDASSAPRAAIYTLRWKGLLLEFLRRQTELARVETSGPLPADIARLVELRGQIASLFAQVTGANSELVVTALSQLTKSREALERRIAVSAPGLCDPMRGLSLAQFAATLRTDEAFIDLIRFRPVTPDGPKAAHFLALVILPGGEVATIDLGAADEIEGLIAVWRAEVVDGEPAAIQWAALVRSVWEPIAARLPVAARRVWLCPEAALAGMPWPLFSLSSPDAAPRLFTQVDAPRELLLLRARPTPPAEQERPALFVGGADFTKTTLQAAGTRKFGPLSETLVEVTRIAELASAQHFTPATLTGVDATKAEVMRRWPRARLAHFATHGFFAPDREMAGTTPAGHAGGFAALAIPRIARNPLAASGLALAQANGVDPITLLAPGLLTAEEIVGLDLSRCELVVLSACDTGRGRETAGQGVLGLRSAILGGGAHSVLMALWPVPDEATRRLMEAFYQALWTEGCGKAEALRRAQKTLRDEPRFRAPVNWAAWVLAGEAW